ncbi:hypothetical protein NEMBOFW57_001563 [Staphylotrichum longicolle]|uniref:DNA polymerase n=1 Tax=Staphylotrichum longicolle TaxID=669026 RepID=A0AAD4HXY9_9PEZI|nr:hypothetical protein NEMBOFW57_001563 [Staphylotrichum longicolle]
MDAMGAMDKMDTRGMAAMNKMDETAMMDVFRVRLNCIDHYQATPTQYDPQLRKDAHLSEDAKLPKVPVIRVFGSTETGQKVCAHIHGAFPYLYVEYRGPLDKPTVSEYIYSLHMSIDRALAVSYRRDQYREPQRFVARVTLVKGVPFYGFHVGYRFYLKIYMLNPVVMTRLADLLQQGVIMGRKFQPYEAHLQYLLQFMTDYNLYGCDYLDAKRVRFRAPVPDPAGPDEPPRFWDSNTIPESIITNEFSLPRVSHCSIEVDVCVQDILNRKVVKERLLHHDFIEREHPIPSDLKLVHSMAGLWNDETKRRKKRMGKSEPGDSPFPREVLVPMSADPRQSQPPGWIHEQEYREQVQQLMEQEGMQDETDFTFATYTKPDPNEETVQTVMQSVEDLFPENLLPALGLEQRLLQGHLDAANSTQVDEQGILALEVSEEEQQQLLPDDSEEEQPKKGQYPKDAESAEPKETPAHLGVPSANSGSGTAAEHDAPEVKPRKLIEDLKWSVNDLEGGVGISGLRSGKRPSIPLPQELLYEATKLEVVSSGDGLAGYAETTGPGTSKRPSSVSENEDPRKRRRCDNQSQVSEPASVDTPLSESSPMLERPKPTASTSASTGPTRSSQPKNSTVKGSSLKFQSNIALSFPVVKDPLDPDTVMRLSQRSASQRSDVGTMAGPTKKQVSFDPLVSVHNTKSGSEASASRTPLSASSSSSPVPQPKLHWTGHTTMFFFKSTPPSVEEVRSTMQSSGLPDVIYQDAFYSNDDDVPPRPREYAGREYRLDGNSLPYLADFDPTGQSPATFGVKPELPPDLAEMELAYEEQQVQCTLRSWEIAEPPPTFNEVSEWWNEKEKRKPQKSRSGRPPAATQNRKNALSQIVGPTPKNTHGFKYSQKQKSTSVEHEAQYMSTMSLEVHANSRGKLVPNPEEDEVQCIFWCLRSDEQCLYGSQSADDTISGIIVLSEDGHLAQQIRSQTSIEVIEEVSELDALVKMVEIVRTYDPDILTGYEVHGSSWGYLVERAMHKYDYDLCNEFSRMKAESFGKSGKDADRWGFKTTSMLHVTGRHIINVWRAMRGELNLLQYSMENVVWHLLHRRIPHYSWRTLSDWYLSGRPRDLSKVLRYYLKRTRMDIEILEANELIPRTSEQARLLGVDFFSVFSRGSQFKVESIMFRIAKPENLLLASPSRKQVGGQNALECLPLVMEPQSAFYPSPLLVLDFQSLYPSVMIAYNYCYSTCLGRVVSWRGTNKLGFTEYKRREGLLRLLKDHINIAPNGMMYTKPEIRKSLLAKMLTEILETRVMVKSGMKEDKDDRTLQKLLHNRQLALKLLANVTYGYTSASFSGRMPCSEIADSIVQTGRETLERAIAFIHSVERWNAEVVYGDTDSLFVYLKGRTRKQAFDIGAEMAKEISDMNPRPVKLKFEKVYHPCVLLAKKRYVGYKYESRDQTVPEFDAKGIETVRRDGTPAEQKIEEKALKILFETADLSQVKEYFQSQCSKIMRAPSRSRTFASRRSQAGHNLIPPLERIFNLVGANVRSWYDEMPKVQQIRRLETTAAAVAAITTINNNNNNNNTKTLESFMNSASCMACGVKMAKKPEGTTTAATDLLPICARCASDPPTTMALLQGRLNGEQRRHADVVKVCQSCAGFAPLEEVPCDSKDCPVFYTRVKQGAKVRAESGVAEALVRGLGEMELRGAGEGEGLDW